MKILDILFIAAFLIHLQCDTSHASQADIEPDYYIKGKEAVEQGLFEEAAQNWIQYADSLIHPEYHVSHDLIRLVTEHRLTDYYEDASRIYLLGLSDTTVDEYERNRLTEELFFFSSIFDRRQEREIRRWIDSGNTQAYKFFRDFWDDRSLTPSDEYNERLMEHWERVNFALKHYNTTSGELFDDRGGVYIRFGEPQRKRDGIFMYNPGFANYLVSMRMDDGRGFGSAEESAVNTTTYLNTLYRVIDYHQYPSFEVWVYYGLSNTPDNTVYLFGNNFGGSQMSLKQSVDDFIPSAAYSSTERNNPMTMNMVGEEGGSSSPPSSSGGERETEYDILFESGESGVGNSERITPALILQLMYYRQLASLDPFFSGRYEEMLDRYESTSMRLSRSLAREFQQLNAARTIITKRGIPEEKSSADKFIYDIESRVFAYRFADESLNPELRIYSEDELDQIISFEELKKRNDLDDIRFEDYRVMKTVRLMEDGDRSADSRTLQLAVAAENPDPLHGNILRVPYSGSASELVVITELYDDSTGVQGEISDQSTIRKNLKGVGRETIRVDEFESSDDFFTSDIIVGYVDREDEHFTISHARAIPENSILRIYYEAYNIPEDDRGLNTFTLTYRLKRDRSTFGRIIRLGRDSYTTMTVDNTTDSPRFEQTLEIISDQLKRGSYSLELIFSVPGSDDNPVNRTIGIRVE